MLTDVVMVLDALPKVEVTELLRLVYPVEVDHVLVTLVNVGSRLLEGDTVVLARVVVEATTTLVVVSAGSGLFHHHHGRLPGNPKPPPGLPPPGLPPPNLPGPLKPLPGPGLPRNLPPPAPPKRPPGNCADAVAASVMMARRRICILMDEQVLKSGLETEGAVGQRLVLA